ncbi:contact-dependent growth inhibition system immunity protein [Xanthomonas oryzae pv. oryzicola]|uniref:contact-dependent growth inhibition system immunity protein n=1 Tax=Xanthomonas oryzae TaxID=347 RepID=UPI003DA17B26
MTSSKYADVCFNGKFYRFITMSDGMLLYADPDMQPKYLDPDVADSELGYLLRVTLAESRQISVEDFHKILNSHVVQDRAKEREKWEMKNYGYKSKRSMLRGMNSCSVSALGESEDIKIQPMHQKSLDGYTARKDTGPFPLFVPKTATDAELGAALREGFKRCTSSIG